MDIAWWLCITGSEAMFADLGHFNMRAIQISFSFITFPAILAAYSGQAAYLRKFPEKVSNTFCESIPGSLYWPTFVVAIAAAIIASQAMISGAFSNISQALSLAVWVVSKGLRLCILPLRGQVYIPEVSYMFMITYIVVRVAFKTTEKISRAYGIAVVCDMMITTSLVSLIMLLIWGKSILLVALFFLLFGCIGMIYLSSQLTKFTGFSPLLFSMLFTMVMGIWHYVHKEKCMYELKNQFSIDHLRELVNNQNIHRVSGIGVMYCDVVEGIPPILPHFIANMPSIHKGGCFCSHQGNSF